MALNVVQGFGKGANLRGKTSLAAGLMGPKTTALEVVQEYGRGANLQGKTALVTGANSGIGLELTKRFAEAGCKVICCVTKLVNYVCIVYRIITYSTVVSKIFKVSKGSFIIALFINVVCD